MKITGSIIIMAVLLLPLSAVARQIDPLEGLNALRRAFSGINDFTAEITQEKQLKLMKRSIQMNGTVRFRKPDLFWMKIAKPYSSTLLLRDGTIEQKIGTNELSRIVLPPDQGLRQWMTRFSKPITALPDGMKIHADLASGLYTVGITPTNGQIQEVTISFNENGEFRKLVITEQNGDRASMVFRKVNRNQGLTERDFRLE